METPSGSERFQEERRRLGHTLESFALVMGVTKSTIGYYENGKTEPNRAGLERAAEAGADVHYIVTGRRIDDEVADRFDWELMLKIAQSVDAREKELNSRMPTDKKLGLVKLLYKRFVLSKKISDSTVNEFVKLVA